MNNLRNLENISYYPFLQHWAYEWQILRDKTGTHYTRYPYYFDDVLETRTGVIGQYWQRMRDVYLSAYLRTLAYAVSMWNMPQRTAEGYCLDIVYGIAGLFDVEPGARPVWLLDFPEKLCDLRAEFGSLIRQLMQGAQTEKMMLVSLNTPVASSVQKHARLNLSAHLVTPDYEMNDGASLYEATLLMDVADTFELKGQTAKTRVQDARIAGEKGDEIAVCGRLFPVPFGCWQLDYMSLGPAIPAPYTVPDAKIYCTHQGIECIASDGAVASITQLWNDAWVPQYPKEGTTRCGTATMMDRKVLAEAQERLGRRLAFFIRLRIWDREEEYGDYSESERSLLLR